MSNLGHDLMTTYPTVTKSGFPYGLRCPLCDVCIDNGQPYSESPTGVMSDGTPVVMIMCVYCKVGNNE